MKRIEVELDDWLWLRLRDEAKSKEFSVSALLRQLLREADCVKSES